MMGQQLGFIAAATVEPLARTWFGHMPAALLLAGCAAVGGGSHAGRQHLHLQTHDYSLLPAGRRGRRCA